MKVTLAVLADYSNISREGKLNILGIFDIIYAKHFPAIHPSMQLVMVFEPELGEEGLSKKILVRLLNQDGKLILEIGGEIIFQKITPGEITRNNHILTLNNVIFEKPGTYIFHILVNTEPKAEASLKVIQKEQ